MKCDMCNKEFNMKVEHRGIEGNIIEEYFKCPHCRHNYHILYMSKTVLKMRAECNRLHNIAIRTRQRRDRRAYERYKKKYNNNVKALYKRLGKMDLCRV